MPDICDSGEGEQPFHLLESALEMDFSKGKERSVFFSGLEADEVISSPTQPRVVPEVLARSHRLAAHVGFFPEDERCHFSVPLHHFSFSSTNNCRMARPKFFAPYLKLLAVVSRKAGEQGLGVSPRPRSSPRCRGPAGTWGSAPHGQLHPCFDWACTKLTW